MAKIMGVLAGFGVFLVIVGLGGLVLGFLGLINFEEFAFGLSSGVRIIGSVAIAGCLLCALGFGWSEYRDYFKS